MIILMLLDQDTVIHQQDNETKLIMYTEQNLYYLNQMGIEPWVLKTTGPRLLVLVAEELHSDKERKLLQAILHFINLSQAEVLIKSITTLNTEVSQFENSSLIAVLLLTDDNEQDKKISCPCFKSPSLKKLLDHPKAKKQLLIELIKIKQLL